MIGSLRTGHDRGRAPAALVAIVLAAAVVGARPAAAEAPFARFFGEYRGVAVADDPSGEVRPRDLYMKVTPYEDGFRVEWTVLIHKPDGRVKRSQFDIPFVPTKREHVYRSAMRKDLFGHATPLDPMTGEPYAWAKVDGDTLTTYALVILEDGGYEMHVQRRTLTPHGMRLVYSRVRDGKVLRAVHGTLARVH